MHLLRQIQIAKGRNLGRSSLTRIPDACRSRSGTHQWVPCGEPWRGPSRQFPWFEMIPIILYEPIPWILIIISQHSYWRCHDIAWQATGLDAWASRVKCPARFMSHLHKICIYIWVVYSLCFFCCLFIIVTWWYVWCFEWASGNQEEVQACLVTLWLFIISCYSLYKTTLGLLCSWFENNPHFHKYSMDFHV